MAHWQPIETAPQEEGFCAIVDNGERIGEAVLYESGDWEDEQDDYVLAFRWRWANHGSCGCCWENMDPKPFRWMPLPERGA